MLRELDPETLNNLKLSFRGAKKPFRILLKEHPNLAAFSNAIRGDEHALLWLFARGDKELGWIAKAILGDEEAIGYLSSLDDKLPISFAFAAVDRIEGKHWLYHNKYDDLLDITKEIAAALEFNLKSRTFWYRIFH